MTTSGQRRSILAAIMVAAILYIGEVCTASHPARARRNRQRRVSTVSRASNSAYVVWK